MESYKRARDCTDKCAVVACACSKRKDSDYLRFRPYHAFTAQPAKTDRWPILRRIALIAVALALLIFSGKFLLYVIT